MGCGSWTSASYTSYCSATSRSVTSDTVTGSVCVDLSGSTAQEVFKARGLHPDMDIRGKVRQCCDTEEHPDTLPVILGIDVTGSMGHAATRCAEKLNPIMTDVLKTVKDVEFSIMGIGDTDYDEAPVQMSQFESDVRIAEHLDKLYFEAGGGPNSWESYSLAWYSGLRHCDLDCWKRGRKGIIITMGDEPLNPYLPTEHLDRFLGDSVQGKRVDTVRLYQEASEKFEIYHINITDSVSACFHGAAYAKTLKDSWCPPLPDDHFICANVDELPQIIAGIIKDASDKYGTDYTEPAAVPFNSGEVISW